MKKWVLFLSIFLIGITVASPIQERSIDPEALSRLAIALDIPKGGDIILETQNRWLRKPGQERWDLTELPLEKRAFVLDWAKEAGLFAPWKPACTSYDKALILGATTSRMQMRLDYLKKLWIEGIRFNEIVWLTGDRPLDPRADGLTERCQNESEASRILWDEADLPQEMRQLPITFIAVPMKSGERRPNTEDTIIAWLETLSGPCQALFVSDQPFCGYQFAVVNSSLPESFLFDLVGPGIDAIDHPAAAAIILDSIARWLYQESLNNQSRNLPQRFETASYSSQEERTNSR